MSQPEEYDDLQKREEIEQENHSDCDSYREEPVQNEDSQDDLQKEAQAGSPYDMNPNYNSHENQYAQGSSPYQNPYENQQSQGSSPYQNPYESQQSQGSSPYQNPYENQQSQGNNPYQNAYGNQRLQSGNPYQNSYGEQQMQGGNPYQNPYGEQQMQGSRPCQSPYRNQQTQNGNGYNNSYGNPYGQERDPYNNPYGGRQAQNGSFQGQNPYAQMPGNGGGQYSPYAEPAKKSNTKLIIGIVAGIIILFLVAVFALTYKAVTLFTEERERLRRNNFEEHEFNDNREKNREERRVENEIDPYDDFDYGYDYYDQDDYYNDYFYDDDYDYDHDQYYTLHDDIKEDLSYGIEFDYYEYDTDLEDVAIVVSYPVIKGNQVPNLEHLNELIQSEVDLFKDYYEEEYADLMGEEGSYFSALSSGYVTYMDEEKLSIAFSEYIYTNDYNYAYLYSINIDMENGVVLDNENILGVDDEFSVEFRRKSDVQNGEISYLTSMTDQEITDYFNSPDIIVFYTPQGMEIGFNYEAGWVTVTYEEFEQYLKVF